MAALKAKIGQLVMTGIAGEILAPEDRRLLATYPLGGFILFERNLKEPAQILSLCRSLWNTGKELPPFIAIDHEGGRVHRLPVPFTRFPPAAMLGRTGDPQLAYEVGQAMARELAAVGINLNFAPVLDVHSNPQNPVIGDRALGTRPDVVIRLAGPLIRGLKDGGVIPCGKHFPGHGDTAQDSHLELPVVEKDRQSLDTVELPPFVHACRDRIESLMTAHVLYPALDPRYPATLSRAIVTALLRQELRHGGVVFGDDLEMKAIRNNFSLEEAVVRSVEAGVDILLFCHGKDAPAQAFEALCHEAEKSPAIRARVDESCARIQRLKKLDVRSLRQASGAGLRERIGPAGHRRIVERIYGNL